MRLVDAKAQHLSRSSERKDSATQFETVAGTAAMSRSGQTEKSGLATGKSALPSRTDIVSPACQVRKVPKSDIDSIDPSAQMAGIVN
jgi:hypothetical protein